MVKPWQGALKPTVSALGEPGEAKHPSNRRKRNQSRFPE
jgi:hypothetical protein